MLRFLSRRKGRGNTNATTNAANDATDHHQQTNASSQIKPQRIITNKNLIQCKVILLDGTDLSVDLSVSFINNNNNTVNNIKRE